MKSILIAAAISLIAGAASAADFSQPLLDQDGHPYEFCAKADPAKPTECLDRQPMTAGKMAVDSLNMSEQSMKPEEIVERGVLALKIRDAKKVELNDKEKDLLKKAIYHAAQVMGYRPVAVVQMLRLVDPGALK